MDIHEKIFRIDKRTEEKISKYPSVSADGLLDVLVQYLEGLGINVPFPPKFVEMSKGYKDKQVRVYFDRVAYGYGYGKTMKDAVHKAVFNNISAHELDLDFKHEGLLFTDKELPFNEHRPMIRIADMLEDKEGWFAHFNSLEYEME